MFENQTVMNAHVTSESTFFSKLLHTMYKENRTESETVAITIFCKSYKLLNSL